MHSWLTVFVGGVWLNEYIAIQHYKWMISLSPSETMRLHLHDLLEFSEELRPQNKDLFASLIFKSRSTFWMLLFYSYMITSEASCWIRSKYVAMTYSALRFGLFISRSVCVMYLVIKLCWSWKSSTCSGTCRGIIGLSSIDLDETSTLLTWGGGGVFPHEWQYFR